MGQKRGKRPSAPEINVGLFPSSHGADLPQRAAQEGVNEMLLLGGRMEAKDTQRRRASSNFCRQEEGTGPGPSRDWTTMYRALQVADEAGEGRDVAADGHGPRRRARNLRSQLATALHSDACQRRRAAFEPAAEMEGR